MNLNQKRRLIKKLIIACDFAVIAVRINCCFAFALSSTDIEMISDLFNYFIYCLIPFNTSRCFFFLFALLSSVVSDPYIRCNVFGAVCTTINFRIKRKKKLFDFYDLRFDYHSIKRTTKGRWKACCSL